jgi:hypothetical protein
MVPDEIFLHCHTRLVGASIQRIPTGRCAIRLGGGSPPLAKAEY